MCAFRCAKEEVVRTVDFKRRVWPMMIAAVLLSPAISRADPIPIAITTGSGLGTVFGEFALLLDIQGNDFRFVGGTGGGSSPVIENVNRPGDTITLGSVGFPFTGVVTYLGTKTTVDPSVAFGNIAFTTMPVMLPTNGQSNVTFTLPFSMSALLGLSSADPTQPSYALTGAGIAVANGVLASAPGEPDHYVFNRITYTFQAGGVAPTPEPASLMLIVGGLALVARSVRKRRK
jgi:hypothetical protein